jgi:hypothetical protein
MSYSMEGRSYSRSCPSILQDGTSALLSHKKTHLKADHKFQVHSDLLPRRRSNSHPEDAKKIVYEYMVDPSRRLPNLWKNEDAEILLLQRAIPRCASETPTSNTSTVNLSPCISSAFIEMYVPVVSLKRSARPTRAAIVSLKRSQNAAELIAFLTCRKRTTGVHSVHE